MTSRADEAKAAGEKVRAAVAGTPLAGKVFVVVNGFANFRPPFQQSIVPSYWLAGLYERCAAPGCQNPDRGECSAEHALLVSASGATADEAAVNLGRKLERMVKP